MLVAGAGPAGWALAGRCARLGLATTVVAPDPAAPWRATYGLWLDECPPYATAAVGPVPGRVRAVAVDEHPLDRDYALLDNTAARDVLGHPAVRTTAGRVVAVTPTPTGSRVRLADGSALTASVVVDATGPRRAGAAQTAYGLVLPAALAAPLVGPDEVLFMDWRASGAGVPSFLYAVPRPDGVLLEETCLAGRPGLPLAVLRTRLLARLAAHGVEPASDTRVERVRIPLDAVLAPPRPGMVRFGAAAGLVHPATGYGVARALSLAPAVAVALAGALGGGDGPRVAARRADRAVWSPAARATRSLRLLGLRALLDLPAELAPAFFDTFFTLPAWARRRYLSGHDDPIGTAAAMSLLFAAVPASVRPALTRAALTRR